MKTNKEKEIDDLFITGLDSPSRIVDFREEDWDAMEAILDKKQKRMGILYWLPAISSAAAVLLALIYIIMLPKNNHTLVKNNPAKQHTNITANASRKTEQATATMPISTRGSRTIISPNITPKYLTVNPAKGGHFLNGATASLKNNLTRIYEHKTTGDLSTQQLISANIPAINLPNENIPAQSSINLQELNKQQIALAPGKYDKPVKKLSTPGAQFAITVLASPDINGVKSFQNGKVGTNAGLLLSVGLGKKFTVSTGAIYAKKPYMTSFTNYKSNYKFKTDPQDVTADCRVLDIPINIDYQIYNRSNHKLSLGSGLSSYIMLRENYHFNYEYPGTSGPTDYNIANQNKHFLGVLNLDATYSHRLNSQFSIAVQPYLKIPLTNIGYSQVKLQSTGIAVGVTWNINSPHKP